MREVLHELALAAVDEGVDQFVAQFTQARLVGIEALTSDERVLESSLQAVLGRIRAGGAARAVSEVVRRGLTVRVGRGVVTRQLGAAGRQPDVEEIRVLRDVGDVFPARDEVVVRLPGPRVDRRLVTQPVVERIRALDDLRRGVLNLGERSLRGRGL